MKFKAFISHSFAEKPVARWLFKRLDGYRPPKELLDAKTPPWRIFLDESELGATDKGRVVAETLVPGVTVNEVARH